jgi:LacI family transcriptional regulator
MATLKQIAEKTNVSITTVSRVLNNDPTLSVGADIREKILNTARKLQYKTPRNRVRLKASQELNIALVLWYDSFQEVIDPYYMQIRKGIENISLKSNVKTKVIYNSPEGFSKGQFDGVVGIIAIGKFSDEQVKLFEDSSKNLVFVDFSPDVTKYDSIVLDFTGAVHSVLDTLIEKGYQTIGYLGGEELVSENVVLGERRGIVFNQYLSELNMLHKEHIHVGAFTSESGYYLMKQTIQEGNIAEVYFCGNDSICLGALRAIHEAGYKIPEDIGLIGFNDSPTSEYTYPPLSSVHVYTEFMGEQALVSLLEQLEGRDVPIRKVIPTFIKHRKSLKE